MTGSKRKTIQFNAKQLKKIHGRQIRMMKDTDDTATFTDAVLSFIDEVEI